MQDHTYETIDDFQIVHTGSTRPVLITRPESPYQFMKAAGLIGPNKFHFDSPQHTMTTPYPIISFQTSSPDEDLLTGNASASELPENAYIEMDKVKTPSNQQYLSVIFAGIQGNGEYMFSIC